MKNKVKIWKLCLMASFLVISGCEDSMDIGNGMPESGTGLSLTPIGQLNQGENKVNSHDGVTQRSSLKMNYRTHINLYPNITGGDSPNYARLKRLADGSWILITHEADAKNSVGWDVHYSTSQDLKKWTYRGMLFERYLFNTSYKPNDKRVFSNGNAIVLSDGELLVFASYRDNLAYKDFKFRNNSGIILIRSKDNGRTWSKPQEIYHGTNWEPHMLELPSGELQCYFTESRPWITDGHSGTSMIVSKDKGRTWSPGLNEEPRRIIRQKWYNQDMEKTLYTDQMPVVIRLNNSDKLVAALESSVSCVNKNTIYNISLAYTGDDGIWQDLKEEELGPADRQDNVFEPGSAAPFIVQFPSGETIISYGYNNRLMMRVGDTEARKFSEPVNSIQGTGYWGCMELNGSHEVVAAMRNSNNANGKVSIELACFELNHRISATRRNVAVDADNAEWMKTDDALFVGEKSQAQATLRCSYDDDNVYFLVEVMDEQITEEDYVNVLLSPSNESNGLTSESRYISVSRNGLKGSGIYNNGNWEDSDFGITAQAACDGTVSDNLDTDNGYLVEIAVPKSSLALGSGEILVNLVLVDSQAGEDAISPMLVHDTSMWIPIVFLVSDC